MAITYAINKCKGGQYGIYVRSLSRAELEQLAYKMSVELRALYPDNYRQLSEYRWELIAVPLGAIPVKSGRIARKPTFKAAQSLMIKFQQEPREQQVKRLHKLFLSPIGNKEYTLLKVAYTQLYRDYNGNDIKLATSIDKQSVEQLALKYAERDVITKQRKTVNRHIKIESGELDIARDKTVILVSKPKGAQKGITKDITDQTNEFLQRIAQKRKRTTTNKFWAKR